METQMEVYHLKDNKAARRFHGVFKKKTEVSWRHSALNRKATQHMHHIAGQLYSIWKEFLLYKGFHAK